MIVLITNDDGIYAPGLAALADAARLLGEPRVVASVSEQSGVGHMITMAHPLRVIQVERDGKFFGMGVYGAPADCVKLAVRKLLPHPPDLLLSGVNLGGNLGINVLYSGTVAAAIEGAMLGIPSMAISVNGVERARFDMAAHIGVQIARTMLERRGGDSPSGEISPILLNVNIPDLPPDQIKGIRVTRQSITGFREGFEQRSDPRGGRYYWITTSVEPEKVEPESDVEAVNAGFVSVTPLHYDLTSHQHLRILRQRLGKLDFRDLPRQ